MTQRSALWNIWINWLTDIPCSSLFYVKKYIYISLLVIIYKKIHGICMSYHFNSNKWRPCTKKWYNYSFDWSCRVLIVILIDRCVNTFRNGHAQANKLSPVWNIDGDLFAVTISFSDRSIFQMICVKLSWQSETCAQVIFNKHMCLLPVELRSNRYSSVRKHINDLCVFFVVEIVSNARLVWMVDRKSFCAGQEMQKFPVALSYSGTFVIYYSWVVIKLDLAVYVIGCTSIFVDWLIAENCSLRYIYTSQRA